MTFVSGVSHKIEVGNLTPTSSGYYVRFDGGKIYVIEQSGIDALLNLLTTPPFPATATPSPDLRSHWDSNSVTDFIEFKIWVLNFDLKKSILI